MIPSIEKQNVVGKDVVSMEAGATANQEPKTFVAHPTLDVVQRLNQLVEWHAEWLREDARLLERLDQLDPKTHAGRTKGFQIGWLRRRLRMNLVKEPLEISADLVSRPEGYKALRENLVRQFVMLSKEQKRRWLQNLLFIMTPDLRKLDDKIAHVRAYRSMGQQRNFLLGGTSGMGKTTYLDWFTAHHLPVVEENRNRIPIIKVDAPVGDRTPKPLLQRIVMECGATYVKHDNEEDLLMQIALYLQKCGIEILIVDEIQHITRHEQRRRLLEISNMTPGIPIICASCDPVRFTDGDLELAGRWNDFFELKPYTGRRLSQLLAFIGLVLPFPKDSSLAFHEIKEEHQTVTEGPATVIEQCTHGILRDIMILIAEATRRAIEKDEPCLNADLLKETWKSIRTNPVTDFLQVMGWQNQPAKDGAERERR
jgi:hypothetical protein